METANPFLVALVDADTEVVRAALQNTTRRGESLSLRDAQGYPPLLIASQRGHHEIVELLLELGGSLVDVNEETLPLVDPNLQNIPLQRLQKSLDQLGIQRAKIQRLRYTPLLLASKQGHADVVELLLKAGADVNKCTGTTALRTAAGNSHEDCVRILLDHGADVSICQPQMGGTALFSASFVGNVGIGTMLIEHGANVNDGTWTNENTCLIVAVLNRHYAFVELLLQHGANPNQANAEGRSPLWFAACKGLHEIQDLLLAHGAKATPGVFVASAVFGGPSSVARLWSNRAWNLPKEQRASRQTIPFLLSNVDPHKID